MQYSFLTYNQIFTLVSKAKFPYILGVLRWIHGPDRPLQLIITRIEDFEIWQQYFTKWDWHGDFMPSMSGKYGIYPLQESFLTFVQWFIQLVKQALLCSIPHLHILLPDFRSSMIFRSPWEGSLLTYLVCILWVFYALAFVQPFLSWYMEGFWL